MGIYAIESGAWVLGGTGVYQASRINIFPHRSGLQPDGHPQKPAGSRPLGASSVPKQIKARAWYCECMSLAVTSVARELICRSL